MPDLRCTVQTCTHNQNYYCNLDSIVVGGNSAKKADETSCDSFEERKGGNSYSNAYSDMAGKEASAKSAWIVRQQTVCITKNVSVMQERSV